MDVASSCYGDETTHTIVAHAVVHYLQEQLLAMSHSTHEFSSHRTENTVHLPAGLDMCSY